MGEKIRLLRKLVRVGRFYALALPEGLGEELGDYVWITIDSDGVLRIEKARGIE
ncbi:MAG: hypothetical protein QW794_05265 [Thermosphaera sp.]